MGLACVFIMDCRPVFAQAIRPEQQPFAQFNVLYS
jgi:hypothetical protein